MRSLFILAFISLEAVYGAQQGITCPRCTDTNDISSCTATQQCHNSHDVCELHVHTAQNNRVEYICHNSHACSNHNSHGCDPLNHEVCTYCCRSIDSCKTQLDQLFSTRYSTAATDAMTTTTDAMTTAADAMTTQGMMNMDTTDGMTTTQANGMMTTDAVTSNSPVASKCIQCGDMTTGQDCSATELLLAKPTACPAGQPYCFSMLSQNGTDIHIVKGCSDKVFCQAEWWTMTSPKPECQTIDLSQTATRDCTFCCDSDNCNSAVRPADSTLLNFSP